MLYIIFFSFIKNIRLLIKWGSYTILLICSISICHAQPNQVNWKTLNQAGTQNALNSEPKEALIYYNKALQLTDKNDTLKRVTLFNIGKMQLWLEQYQKAELTYNSLLKMPLDNQDHELALAGLVKSLAYQDKPRYGYNSIPENLHYTLPNMVLAATQAALWSDWSGKAKKISDNNQSILKQVDPKSTLYRDLKEVTYATNAETAKNKIIPSYEFEHDNDGTTIMHYNLEAFRSFFPDFSAGLGFTSTAISNNNQRIHGENLFAEVMQRINDYINYQAKIGYSTFDSWNHTLWSANLGIQPNDIISFSFSNQQENVETIAAINNKTTFNTTQIKATISPIYRLKISGSIFYGMFSDDNNRTGYFASANYLLFDKIGLSTEIRARGYHSSKTDTVGYFNPANLEEQDLILKLNHRLLTNWKYYVTLCILGHQEISPGDTTSPKFIEVGINGFITKNLLLNASYGYSNSNFSTAEGYGRHYGMIALQVLF